MKKYKSLYEKTINENLSFYAVTHLSKILWKMLHTHINTLVLKVKIKNIFEKKIK